MRENWDDLRFVLAVAEEGSVNAAARRLGVNHATVLRRIAAYEEASGVEIFDKTARGYVVTSAHKRVIEAAREVDRAVQSVARSLEGVRAPLTGDVRVTSTDTFCQYVLPPVVSELRKTSPELRIELLCTNTHLDLARTHADITVRPTDRLADDLIGEIGAKLGFGVFRRRDCGTADWLSICGPLSRSLIGRWMADKLDSASIVACADSFPVLREMAAAGQGMTPLPYFLGHEDARLEEVTGLIPDISVDVWVASHADLADVPRIAETRKALVAALGRMAERLRGAPMAAA